MVLKRYRFAIAGLFELIESCSMFTVSLDMKPEQNEECEQQDETGMIAKKAVNCINIIPLTDFQTYIFPGNWMLKCRHK